MENLDFDVIICGGGPGGSACAMGFVDTNIRVAVIEKSKFPREKVCGDGMAPYIPKALNMMSPKFKAAFDDYKNRLPIQNVMLVAYDGNPVTLPFPEPWFISTRYNFDNFLYEQASSLPNVSFFLEEQVTGVSISDTQATVKTDKNRTFTGKMVIGCDGATSVVRRQLTNYQMDPAFHCAAVRAYYTEVDGVSADTLEIHYIPKYPNGYFWVFPSENGNANIGFGMLSQDITNQKLKLRDVLSEIIEITPHLKPRFTNAKPIGDIKGWSIPMGYGKTPISGDRFVLVGDAASVADPLTGEGIGQAIVTGRIAAFHVKDCFANNNFSASFNKTYDKAIDEKWGKQNRRRRYWSELIFKNNGLVNILFRMLGAKNIIGKITWNVIMKLAK